MAELSSPRSQRKPGQQAEKHPFPLDNLAAIWAHFAMQFNLTPADIVGYTASVVGTAVMLPQVVQSFRSQHMHDVSFASLLLYCLNCGLWGAYSIMIAAPPSILANGLGLLMGVGLLGLKIKLHGR